MKLTIGLKLKPTAEQSAVLKQTLERANAAANEVSRVAWQSKTFSQFAIHKLTHKPVREKYSLAAQLTVRVIAKVADAYKLDKRKQRVFSVDGSIAYDDRILRYSPLESSIGLDYVSIWTIEGRQQIPFVCGPRERMLLHSRQGESDLVFRQGKWYLFATVNMIEPPTDEPDGFLGVDLGIARIATDSAGQSFSGAHVRNLRKRQRKLRARLQSKGTTSAKRLLKKRSLKEKRFATKLNHEISKAIVLKAKHTKQGIALEDLTGIRSRVRVRKADRAARHSWSFFQLRIFIEYKAKMHGVAVVFVDPRNSSRQCSQCGHIAQSNRKSQSVFQCRQCGFSCHADINAARNLSVRGRALVNAPIAVKPELRVRTESRLL